MHVKLKTSLCFHMCMRVKTPVNVITVVALCLTMSQFREYQLQFHLQFHQSDFSPYNYEGVFGQLSNLPISYHEPLIGDTRPIAGPMFCLRWCCWPFTCRRETRVSPTQICAPAQTFARSERKRELRRPETNQLGGHTFLTDAAWNKIRTKCEGKHWLGFVRHFFIRFPGCSWNRWCRWTNLHACDCEANQNSVTMPRLKRRFQVMLLGPKKASEAISDHPISIKFSWGSMPPDSLSLNLCANARIHANSGASVSKPDQSNFCFRQAWHVALKTSVNVITVVALCLHVGVKLSVCGYYSCMCFSMHVELKTSVNVVMLYSCTICTVYISEF